MRMSPLSDRAQLILLSPLLAVTLICIIPLAVMVAPIAWPMIKFSQWQENRGWHRWFAWRPVKLSGFFYDRPTKYVWLETVERRVFPGAARYRFPGEGDT